jgi:uncharacterized membrane protein YfcA
MDYWVVCSVALLASALTFFSGFGLGTLLLPAFALFVPTEQAVALTAVVHLLNSVFKLSLTGKHADWRVILRFGLPAMLMSFAGAWLLVWLAGGAPLFTHAVFGRVLAVTPLSFIIGLLLLVFALLEFLPAFRNLAFPPKYLPVGGVLSGFFGGLSGMQGALRSAFLVRAGLSKESFIATGVALACVIDLARLTIYSSSMTLEGAGQNGYLLAAAVLAAFAGAVIGNSYLRKMTMPGIQRFVAVLLVAVALGLMSGLL